MALVRRILADSATYRRLVYLLSGIPLGIAWFVALVTLWSLCFGLLITPFGIPLLIGLSFITRGFAAVEAEIARALLDVDARSPSGPPSGRGFWRWFRGLFDAGFWRAQAYLLIRWLPGFAIGIALLSLITAALGMIFAPAWVPFVHGGAHLGFWRPHTFLQSLALVPVGVVLLPVAVMIANPIGAAFRPIASSLLPVGTPAGPGTLREPSQSLASGRRAPVPPRRAFEVHAAVDGVVLFLLVLIWALTSRGYFWPIWVALPFGVALAIHGWTVLLHERPSLVDRFRGNRTLAVSSGVGVVVAAYFIAVWAITGHGYFWPVWPMLAIAFVLGIEAAAALLSSPGRTEMAERIETLETSRAGAVNLQDSELRRIERDLHDGAQARLVALGMSLGMAEQKLAEDPGSAGELLAEARVGAEHALRELRDLARGIHPPVLADRGLGAALLSLANAAPMKVTVSVDTARRPPPAVETAAYFVAAEALANAAKHARATRVEIRVTRAGDTLELRVDDDGVGGANPNGTGILGMRRRVEALDGTLIVNSPPGGPTTIRAEMPCAS
jgi:signal transduction histidine kinase